jgi:tetratricopeptide (TPR) repeat protein
MSTFQFLLLLITAVIFILFFKQLFSGSFPKRGLDYEANNENDQIGGISQMDKTFSTPEPMLSRVGQLINMADTAIGNENFNEADKALSSALILEPENQEVLFKYGFVLITLERYTEAKETYLELLMLDENDDQVHVALANVLHKLGENDEAIVHHEKAIQLDGNYAPHYFNYANTLYYMDKKERALELYKRAFELDNSLEPAKKMIKELSNG